MGNRFKRLSVAFVTPSLLASVVVVGPANEAIAVGSGTVEVRVSSGSDDSEESASGDMYSTSSDLELVNDGSRGDQTVGVRFTGVGVPAGAHVDNAYIQFQVDETTSGFADLSIEAEASDSAAPLGSSPYDLSSRPLVQAAVTWMPPDWGTKGAAGLDQRTPSIAALVQQIIDRPGWAPGNAMLFLIGGTGKRVAESYDGDSLGAPLLHVEYSNAVSVQALDDTATEGASPPDSGIFRLMRSEPSDVSLTVAYELGGSASSGIDYQAPGGTAVIPAGTAHIDIVIEPIDDDEVEGSETVTVTVVAGPDYSPGTQSSATVTLFDDDTPTVSVFVDDATAVEGTDPADTAGFTFVRAGPVDQELVVSYAMGGEALSGTDYSAPTGVVTIPAGSTDAGVTFRPLEDAISEGPESFNVTVTAGSGYAVGASATASAVIVDNDPIADIPIGYASDDAEEDASGSVNLHSGDLELAFDPAAGSQLVGLRFTLPAAQGALITSAWLQFQSADADLEAADLLIEAQASDDAATFTDTDFGISSRPRTAERVMWSPEPWEYNRLAGLAQRTPDLSALIQEVVDRPGWVRGNAVVLLISGLGRRVADSFDGDPGAAPVLHVEYAGIGAPENRPPVVEAEGESTVYPNSASLGGSVSDDLLPSSSSLTTLWSKVSGPGTVTFSDASVVDTDATFSEPGQYSLRLTADDGELAASDTILISAVDPAARQVDRMRAVVFGDYGIGCCEEADVAGLVATLAPDIIITTGDNRYVNDMDYSVGQFYSDYIGNYQGEYGMGSAINRFFPAVGNHDYSELGGLDVFLDYFSLPGGAVETSASSGNERYYDFVYGPVHFFAVDSDPDEPDGTSVDSTQAQWLRSQLALSSAPWQVVYMHHPPYSSGSGHGATLEMQWPFEAWGADAVLAGHDHVYERIVKGSFPYLVIGNGGAGLYTRSANPDPDSQFFYDAAHGAMVVDACSSSLTFEFHSVSEGLLDSYTLGSGSCSAGSPPVAVDDSSVTSEDDAVQIDVLANDSDPDGNLDPGLLIITGPAGNGSTLIGAGGLITYTPVSDFNGGDSFIYEVCDTTALCDTATVSVTVDPVNDPPVALDDWATTTEDTPVTVDVLSNDADIDDFSLSVSGTTQPANGSTVLGVNGTVTYTPGPNFHGTDVFAYTASDGVDDSLPATVTVTVTPQDDHPVAAPDTVYTVEETAVVIDVLANDSDPDGDLDPTSLQIVVEPSIGSVRIESDLTVTYTPDTGASGNDAFTYEVCDATSLCDTAQVSVIIGAVNDPPVAGDDWVETSEDTPVLFDAAANDSDPDGDIDRSTISTACSGCADPANGSLSNHGDGTFTYDPAPNFNGGDIFTYEVCDIGGLCDTATVVLTVNAVEDAPVAADDFANTYEDTPVTVNVIGNDSDVENNIDLKTVRVTSEPGAGTAISNGDGTIGYVPDLAVTGSDSFVYEVCDTAALCDSATVTIEVLAAEAFEQFAQSEETVEGSVAGSYSDTFSGDGVFEEIIERHSGGPPATRQSQLLHKWLFRVQRGDSIEIVADAFHTVNSEGDDFLFEYSTDGGITYTSLFIVTDTGGSVEYTASLPNVISGELLVRVTDTDRTPGHGSIDSLFIDLLVIATTNPQTPLPEVTVTASDDTAAELGDSGVFTIHRNDTTEPLTVEFTLSGTAIAGVDYSDPGQSVEFAPGQADAMVLLEPLSDTLVEGDESVVLTIVAGAGYSRASPWTATVLIVDDDVDGSEARATSENPVSGSVVSGSLTSTYFADGDLEIIEEELYAGQKRSRLEHIWSFDLVSGSEVTLYLLADHVGSESFTFSYSSDAGASWIPLDVAASGTQESEVLPATIRGAILVRVEDDDRSRDEPSIDAILIDELYFLVGP